MFILDPPSACLGKYTVMLDVQIITDKHVRSTRVEKMQGWDKFYLKYLGSCTQLKRVGIATATKQNCI